MSEDKFVSVKEFEEYIRGNGLIYDVVYIANVAYTMDYYDSEGKLVTFGNKKAGKGFEIVTENRYGDKGYTDANVREIEDPLFRNDINYYDDGIYPHNYDGGVKISYDKEWGEYEDVWFCDYAVE